MVSETRPPERYLGPNRRKGEDRRQTANRREEFRFEPQKVERRSGKDRRKQGGWDDTQVR